MTFDEWWDQCAPRTVAVRRAVEEPNYMIGNCGNWTKELCRVTWDAAVLDAENSMTIVPDAIDPEANLGLYLIQWDGGSRYVEADTFGQAVALWLEAMKAEWGEDWRPDDEPESVTKVDDCPALRASR